jgi:hypothetical protein
VNFERRTGSLRMAIQEFSIRVDLMNPDPMPVMPPFATVSPVEYSLKVSPTKLAIFFPLVKRDRSSPSSRINLIAVNHPIREGLRQSEMLYGIVPCGTADARQSAGKPGVPRVGLTPKNRSSFYVRIWTKKGGYWVWAGTSINRNRSLQN